MLAVVAAALSVSLAWGYLTTSGGGTASATVATLNAATISVPATSTGSHAVTWDQQATITGNPPDESDIDYFVERKQGAGSFQEITSGDCDGPLPHPTTSCTDTVAASGSYTYRVIAKFRSWTATSNEAGAVVVTVNTGPAAPTSVALANGGGVGNAYINAANKANLSVDVGLGATSTAADTVHVTITDGTNTTADKTAPATAGEGTVTVTGIDATSLNDGSVTIRATVSNAAGTSGPTTTSVSKDTVQPTSSATSAQYASSAPITVSYTAADGSGSGVKEVELWARKGTSGAFTLAATDTDPSTPSFAYTPSDGEGTYEFYTRARDNAANYEDAPINADSSTVYDLTNPSSSANSPQYANSAPITVTYTATDGTGSGVKEVQLWAKKSTDASYALVATDSDPSTPSFAYTPSDGAGTYQFYTRAIDNALRQQTAPATPPDASTIYDLSLPTSSVSSISSSISAATTLTIPYTAADTGGSGLKEVELWVKKPGEAAYSLFETRVSSSTSGSFSYPITAGDDGTHSFYTRARDNAGNYEAAPGTADRTTSVTIRPRPILIQAVDIGGTPGKLEAGDQFLITFDEAVLASSIRTGWTDPATPRTNQTISFKNNSDKDEIENVSNPLNIGLIKTNGDYISANVSFTSSTLSLSSSGKTLIVTLGGNPGNINATPVGAKTMEYTPDGDIDDLAGNPMETATIFETGTPADVDF